MSKHIRSLLLILLIGLTFTLASCNNEGLPAEDSFSITFVDYDGSVLKTIDCTVGETCDIIPPTDPNNKENAYFTRWSLFESQYSSIDRDIEIDAIYTLDNRVVTIGNRSIVFYSFFIISGIMFALFLGTREMPRIGMKNEDLIDGFLWIVPIAILGSRLWYVAFELSNFLGGGFFPSLLRILGFRTGTLDFSNFGLSGLAIHGAFVTAMICAYFYTRRRKIDLFKVFDVVAIGFIIAQAFGRWGNFFNQEAHGGVVGGMTNGIANLSIEEQYNFLKYTLHLPQFIVNNMYIVGGLHSISVEPITAFYHPTFFYESMFNVLGFIIMLLLRRMKKIHFGELLSFYLVWYGGLRIFIETMRTDPLVFEIFGITMKSAIVTSVLMIAAGVLLSVYIRIKRKGLTYGTVPGYFGYKKEQQPKEVVEE